MKSLTNTTGYIRPKFLLNYERVPIDPHQRLAAEVIKSGLTREGTSYILGRCGQYWTSIMGLDAEYLFVMAGGVGHFEASADCDCDTAHFFGDSMTPGFNLEPDES